jgi:hypothetical protein
MNVMLSSRRRRYITRVGLSLLIVALIAGMAGCATGSARPVRYDLTLASAEGGSVTAPGEGTFTCDAARVVDLVATPTSGYRFVNWTGGVSTIANVNAASTTVTMNDNYSITAKFEQTAATYYTLTMAVTGSGSTSPAVGQHTYAAGTVVPIIATPAGGYHFVNWTGNVGTIANVNAASTTITMNSNYSITANFEEIAGTYYALTIAVTGSGSTNPAVGQHTYAAGTVVPIVATPAGGYHFVNWTGNVGTIANVNAASTTITMNSNYSITANFEEIAGTYYALTIAVTGSGSTSPAVGQHTYAAGTVVPIIATPAGGYHFVNWTGNVGTIANVNAASTTITMNGNYSITANFSQIPVTYYVLTIAVTGSGSTSPALGQHTYPAGTVVPIIATPAGGYHFVNWTGNVGTIANVNAASTTITMNGNYSITANFEEIAGTYYTLTMAVTGSGSTSPAVGQHTYAAGTVVPIIANPANGYHFVNWTGNVGTIANVNAASTTITMNGNYSITANFSEIPVTYYVLTIAVTGSGSTNPAVGQHSYAPGTVVPIVANPASGYHFVNWTGNVGTIANVNAASTTIAMNGSYSITANFEGVNFMVSAGGYHTVGLKADGTVVAVGDNGSGECNVGSWTNIIRIAAGNCHTVGLRSNGTVVATGDNGIGQCNVGGWTDITQVAAGSRHTVGLKSDGTVVAVGYNYHGQCNVGAWTNIVQVAAGAYHTVGLRADGTVIAVGYTDQGQCNVGGWTDIIQVSAGLYHTVGLKADGTVVAVGDNGTGQCDVTGWTDVIQVSAGWLHTVGLRANGTVVAVGYDGTGQCNVSGWTNIIQVSANRQHTVGLRSDGTVVAVGYDDTGQCNVSGWDLN